MKIHHHGDHAERRRAEYPNIGDQLDALWKALDGKELPPEAAEIVRKIKAVKEKYPKKEQA